MKTKDDSVNIWGLQPCMQPVLKHADAIWTGAGQELIITSGRDGIHSAGSLHYYGLAVDLRTRYFDEGTKAEVARALKDLLGPMGYDVIVHSTHIHVEAQQAFDKVMENL